MKKIIQKTISILGILALVAIVIAFFSPHPKQDRLITPTIAPTNIPEPTIVPTETPKPVPTQVVEHDSTDRPERNLFYENYMRGCVSATDGSKKMVDYCECTYDFMIEEYGFDDFVEIAIKSLDSEEIPPELMRAVNSCLKHLKVRTN